MTARTVKHVHAAARDDIGDLVTRRPVPGPQLEHLDPFLFLNHHGPQTYPAKNRGLPFGPHPHRGFETVSFILSGSMAHKDSSGAESVIDAGGVQWMTAGRGLVHAETSPKKFLEQGGPLEILQLWVNLPSRWKMTAPKYIGLQKKELATHHAEDEQGREVKGVVVTPVSGEWFGHHGPIEPLTDVALATVVVDAGARFSLPVWKDKAVFCYVVKGALDVGAEFSLVEFNGDGDSVDVEARETTTLLLGTGTPFGEPIVSYGPFVMNTEEEIRQAIFDAQSGKLGGKIGR